MHAPAPTSLSHPLLAALVVATAGCGSGSSNSTESTQTANEATPTPQQAADKTVTPDKPAQTKPVATGDGAAVKPTPANFGDYLATLDKSSADSLHLARDRFAASHPKGTDEGKTTANFDLLLEFYADTMTAIEAKLRRADANLEPYLCSLGDYCEQPFSGVRAATKKEVERMLAAGVRVVPGGEGTPALDTDLIALTTTLRDQLPAGQVAFSETAAFHRDNVTYDDGAFAGEFKGVGEALVKWEKLAKTFPGAYPDRVKPMLYRTFYEYVLLCTQTGTTNGCKPIERVLQGEYKRFVRAHKSSKFRPAIKTFIATSKRKRHRWTVDELEKFVRKHSPVPAPPQGD